MPTGKEARVSLVIKELNDFITEEDIDIDEVTMDDNPNRIMFHILRAMNEKRDKQLGELVQDIIYALETGAPTNDLYNQLSRLS